ncbi:MAG: OmpA family protein [Bacteroidales bacterium]|nr:OmpA family protein [Bacteroidales bacterium]
MKIYKSLLTLAVAMGSLTMAAQPQAEESVEYDFHPTWFVQAQAGGQETLGEGSFGKLLRFNTQITVGRQFSPLWAVRLGIGSWQSVGTEEFWPTETNSAAEAFKTRYPDNGREYWHYKYVAPAVDVLFNVTNAIGGYNPERLCDFNIFAGIGMNIAWGNDGANEYNSMIKAINSDLPGLQHIWDGTHTRLLGRLGAALDFRLNDNWKIGLEFNANFLNDHYNSKKAENADWYFNLLAGVKYTFGQSYTKRVVRHEPQVIERVVEKIVEVPVQVDEVSAQVVMPETMRRDVFFSINSWKITIQEMQKVRDIAEFMKANPETKVSITGYADRNTGTLAINVRLAKQRAEAVAKALVKNYGISEDRMIVDSMKNEDYQPFQAPDPYQLNRVAICIVE